MSSSTPKTLMDFVQEARALIKEVDGDTLTKMIESDPNVLVVDIREPSEHEHGHLKNAHLVPRGILEAAADLTYPTHDEMLYSAREKSVVLYCATGGRSAMGAMVLQMMGFKNVYSLAGGIMKWNEEKRPLVKEASYV